MLNIDFCVCKKKLHAHAWLQNQQFCVYRYRTTYVHKNLNVGAKMYPQLMTPFLSNVFILTIFEEKLLRLSSREWDAFQKAPRKVQMLGLDLIDASRKTREPRGSFMIWHFLDSTCYDKCTTTDSFSLRQRRWSIVSTQRLFPVAAAKTEKTKGERLTHCKTIGMWSQLACSPCFPIPFQAEGLAFWRVMPLL